MRDTGAPAIGHLVQRQAEDLAVLGNLRLLQVSAPHVALRHLRRIDDRIAAHLDALAVAGEEGVRTVERLLADVGHGEVFAATLLAIVNGEGGRLERLLALAEAVPAAETGLLSAFNFVSARFLTGMVRDWLRSPHPFRRRVGIAVCAMHGVDPGAALADALNDGDAALRATALRVIGECGLRDRLDACLRAVTDGDEAVRLQAARSAALLGAGGAGSATLTRVAMHAGPAQAATLRLVLALADPAAANGLLATLARTPAHSRALIRGTGQSGDPHYVAWLIRQMQDVTVARVAGESFALMTGLDLAWLDLDLPAPPPSADDEDDADQEEDDGLPWPDPARIGAWWAAHGARFQPGVRYFMGEVPTPAHCRAMLRDGYQRQRIAAAEYLCLLQPGTRLFPTAAPAWRQQRWLQRPG